METYSSLGSTREKYKVFKTDISLKYLDYLNTNLNIWEVDLKIFSLWKLNGSVG